MSHKKLIAIVLIIVTILVSGFVIYAIPSSTSTSGNTDTNTTGSGQSANAQKASDTVKGLNKSGISQADEEQRKTVGVYQQVTYDQIQSQMRLPLTDLQKKDGRVFVRYEPRLVESLKVGDELKVQALEFGVSRMGKIVSIEQVDDDIKRWIGEYPDHPAQGNLFRITRSVKDDYALMVIYTDSGIYEMESKGGVGWVRPSRFEGGDDTVPAEKH